jgi:hypothetical protein
MLSSALHFRNVPHPWALPVVKHEVKVIMNLNIPRSLGIGGGKALTLTHKSGRDLKLLLSVTFLLIVRGRLTNIRCPPITISPSELCGKQT